MTQGAAAKKPTKKTTSKTAGKTNGKAKKKAAPGNDRIAALADRFKTTPGGGKPRQQPLGDAASAAASLIGSTGIRVTQQRSDEAEPAGPPPQEVVEPISDRAIEPAAEPAATDNQERAETVEEAPAEPAQAAPTTVTQVAPDSDQDDEGERDQDIPPRQVTGAQTARVLASVPPLREDEDADQTDQIAQPPQADQPETGQSDESAAGPATQPGSGKGASAEETAPAAPTAPAVSADSPAAQAAAEEQARLEEFVKVLSGPEFSLDSQHERISKLTLELPVPLVDVLNRWELNQVRRTGRRLYRERLVDMALAELPEDPEQTIARARDLPGWLKYADTEQVGTRVRASIALDLKVLKQEMKLRREKGTYVRHVYAAAILDLLSSYGVEVAEPVG